ncbi:MAG: NAD-dependent succinate-semialdehyde dehydrogenase [Opitutaceae bacterium]|nr:NAD-dependent succinate-semialdehyde dehydrogenase [Opitutaceae bacterium]
MPMVSINPATGKLLQRYRATPSAGVEKALARAAKRSAAWRHESLATRSEAVRALGVVLRARRDSLAALITAEMGKPITQAQAEIEKCAACCEYYARQGASFLTPETPPESPAGSEVWFEPLGTVLAIMPWNFPFWQLFRAAAPAFIAGNAILLKHASNVSGCALAIESVAREAGLPAGLLQTLLVPPSAIAGLLADPRIRAVTLTGSTEAGRSVAALAGKALKPAVLELGGSDPYLIFEDADLDAAAECCASARLVNNGQSCVAAKRFIVARSLQVEFARRLAERMAARKVGDPCSADTDLGPLAREDLRTSLHQQVTASIKGGARLLSGGTVPKGPGAFYPPVVLTHVPAGTPAFEDELFGPVAAVIPARNEADALRLANHTPFGLGAAVFTRDSARAERVAKALDCGMVTLNGAVRSEVALPFGGTKESGLGRELGVWGVRSFVNIKAIRRC